MLALIAWGRDSIGQCSRRAGLSPLRRHPVDSPHAPRRHRRFSARLIAWQKRTAVTTRPGSRRATRTGSGCRKSCCSRRRSARSSRITCAFERFPDIATLAAAPQQELRILGRARLLRPARAQPAPVRTNTFWPSLAAVFRAHLTQSPRCSASAARPPPPSPPLPSERGLQFSTVTSSAC